MNQPLSPGRIVLVCIGFLAPDGYAAVASAEQGEPVLRPAIVTRMWSDECFNGTLLLDGTNDLRFADDYARGILTNANCEAGTKWVTSCCRGDGIGQWRWPARV